jgi:hypothetical protein
MRLLVRMCSFALLVAQLGGCASMSQMGHDFGEWIDGLKQMVVGPSTETSSATRDEAVKHHPYAAAQGQRLEVESASNTPTSVAPGGVLESLVTYTVIAPGAMETILLTATRTVIVDGEAIPLGKPRQWKSPQGTRTTSVKLTIPENMPKGDYKLITTISDGRVTRTAKTTFSVI